MKLVLVGISGAGKGTQAKNLCNRYNIPHISTGDILRHHISQESEIGLKVKSIMESGKLVDDDLVVKLVKLRIHESDCKKGFILDGFPRTIVQAKKLFEVIDLDKAIYIKIDDKEIIDRLSNRLTCTNCGAMYHKINSKPLRESICDICGSRLIVRDDDKEATVKTRLKVFYEMTVPIIDFYRDKGLLLEVSGIGNIKEITDFIVRSLER